MSKLMTPGKAAKVLDADQAWLEWVCRGNRDAADFLHLFFLVCHLWDDLIDKDCPRSDEHINHAFWCAFVEIPRNRYYKTFQADIQPVMANAIQEWFAANALEADERPDIAYTLRCSIVSLVHQAAEICGGYEWALEVGSDIRKYMQAETYDEYLGELHAERRDSSISRDEPDLGQEG